MNISKKFLLFTLKICRAGVANNMLLFTEGPWFSLLKFKKGLVIIFLYKLEMTVYFCKNFYFVAPFRLNRPTPDQPDSAAVMTGRP